MVEKFGAKVGWKNCVEKLSGQIVWKIVWTNWLEICEEKLAGKLCGKYSGQIVWEQFTVYRL